MTKNGSKGKRNASATSPTEPSPASERNALRLKSVISTEGRGSRRSREQTPMSEDGDQTTTPKGGLIALPPDANASTTPDDQVMRSDAESDAEPGRPARPDKGKGKEGEPTPKRVKITGAQKRVQDIKRRKEARRLHEAALPPTSLSIKEEMELLRKQLEEEESRNNAQNAQTGWVCVDISKLEEGKRESLPLYPDVARSLRKMSKSDRTELLSHVSEKELPLIVVIHPSFHSARKHSGEYIDSFMSTSSTDDIKFTPVDWTGKNPRTDAFAFFLVEASTPEIRDSVLEGIEKGPLWFSTQYYFVGF